MIITVDSNVVGVAAEVARVLPSRIVSSAPWCSEPCVCSRVDAAVEHEDRVRVLYDTPLAMCHDTDIMFADEAAGDSTVTTTDPTVYVPFVYIDAAVKNNSYKRIKNNLSRFENTVVVLANADANVASRRLNADLASRRLKGTYTVVLDKNNCGTAMAVKFLAFMLTNFVISNKILHPDSLVDAVRYMRVEPHARCIRAAEPVRCDLYRFNEFPPFRSVPVDDCDSVAATKRFKGGNDSNTHLRRVE